MDKILYRIAQLEDVENVFSYEYEKNFSSKDISDIEKQMLVWDSFFRKESLEHYFKSGWSFIALNQNSEVVGFFMGQALLFLDKQTQSLWIEYISANNMDIYTELVDIAYRLSREKHFQKVLFSQVVTEQKLNKEFDFKKWERVVSYLKTTKQK